MLAILGVTMTNVLMKQTDLLFVPNEIKLTIFRLIAGELVFMFLTQQIKKRRV